MGRGGLLRTVVRTVWLGLLVVVALVAYLLGVNELVVLFGGAAVAVLARGVRRAAAGPHGLMAPLIAPFLDPTAEQLGRLFWTMLKIGAVLYGSGYVLIAFLERDFVDRLGWITQAELFDAVAIGQVTPGPVFTTATFVGYLVAGPLGAFLATVAIFAPSFLFVGLLTRLAERMRASPWASALLDGVNATAYALMAAVSWQLGREALIDAWTAAIAVVTLLLLWRTRLNSAWYVLGGAVVGLIIGR